MKESKAITACLPCTVIRDIQEKPGHGWIFNKSKYCAGTTIQHLKTGDYTLKGFENYLAIERKESVTEFVGSMTDPAFRRELERMAEIEAAYVILEFEMDTLLKWPSSSALYTPMMRGKLPLQQPGSALTKFIEITMKYNHIHFLFAGKRGQMVAGNVFKRVIEKYAKFVAK